MASGIVINSVRDALAAALLLLEPAHEEVVWLVPPSIHTLSQHYDFVEKARAFVRQGGILRGIVAISHANVGEVQAKVANGEDVRHSDEVHELFMYVADRRHSVSAINVGVAEYALDTPVTAFWSERPDYAEYLLPAFEAAWARAVPARQRIDELLERG